MPAWFLRLWITAQAITGQYYVTVANGIFQFVSVVGGYFLASGTASASPVYPTANGLNSIDIQTTRVSSAARALGTQDIVIGSESGTAAAGSRNISIGRSSTSQLTSSDNILLGPNNTFARSGASQPDTGANVNIGAANLVSGAGGANVFVSSGLTLSLNANQAITGSAVVGPPGALALDGSPDSLAFIGAGCYGSGTLNSSGASGVFSGVGSSGGTNTNAYVFGVSGTLQNDNTTRVSNGGGGSQAAIDIVSGATVNTSLVKLGVSPVGSEDLPGGANAAYAFALADQGKGIVASAVAVTLANNRTLTIITGTTNGTITMPANPIEGQIVRIAFDGSIAAMTIVANTGHTIRNTLTAAAVAAGSCVEFTFNLAANGGTANAWYRTG